MAERKLPQNLEAEMNVLGCAFLTTYALEKVCEELSSDMFLSEANKRIFEAIYELHQNKIPLDSATVKNEIEKKGSINIIGGIEYLSDVIDSVITAANVDYYIDIVKKQNIGKIDILDMIENNYVLNRLSERTYGNPDLVSYEMIEEEVADLAEDHAKKRIETLKQGNEIMLREKDLKIQEAENVSKRKDKQIDYFINRKAKSIELIIKVPLVIISSLMFIAIFIIVLYTTINSYIRDEANLLKTIGMITIMIGDIAGYIWGFITKQKKIYKGIDKLAKKCSNKYIKKIEDKIDKIE